MRFAYSSTVLYLDVPEQLPATAATKSSQLYARPALQAQHAQENSVGLASRAGTDQTCTRFEDILVASVWIQRCTEVPTINMTYALDTLDDFPQGWLL